MTKSYYMVIKPPVGMTVTANTLSTAVRVLVERNPVNTVLQFRPLLNQRGSLAKRPLVFRNVFQ